jgi:hypothetical protein
LFNITGSGESHGCTRGKHEWFSIDEMIGWEGRLGDRPVRSLQGCTNANKLWNQASKKGIEHQNNSRQPGRREGEVTRGLVQKQRRYQITDQPEHEKKIRKM